MTKTEQAEAVVKALAQFVCPKCHFNYEEQINAVFHDQIDRYRPKPGDTFSYKCRDCNVEIGEIEL